MGNETCVAAGRVVPPNHNLQGDLLYPGGVSVETPAPAAAAAAAKGAAGGADVEEGGGKGGAPAAPARRRPAEFDIFAPGAPPSSLLHKLRVSWRTTYVVALTFWMEAMVSAVCWAPGSSALVAMLNYLRVEALWSTKGVILISIPGLMFIVIVGLPLLALWMRLQMLLWRGYALWRKKSAAGTSLRVRMLGEGCVLAGLGGGICACLLPCLLPVPSIHRPHQQRQQRLLLCTLPFTPPTSLYN